MGRQSEYTPEILQIICDRLAEGEPLEEICRDDHIPSSGTVRSWMRGEVVAVDKEIVSSAIAHARDVGFDKIAFNTRLIARGTSAESTGDVQRDKLIVETDLKLLAKWNPKRYGDKTTLASDPENPITGPVINLHMSKGDGTDK